METRKLLANGISRNISKKFKFNKQLADALGVDKVVVSSWTSGASFPRPDTIDAIAAELDISTATLFCTSEEQAALELGLQIKKARLENLVHLVAELSPDDLDMITRIAKLAANQK